MSVSFESVKIIKIKFPIFRSFIPYIKDTIIQNCPDCEWCNQKYNQYQ